MREADYDAYDLDDPKHPDWEDAAAERADLERKRDKEDAAEALSRAGRQGPLLADQRTQGFPLSRAERKPVSDRGKRAWVFLGLACFFAGMWILVEQAQARPPVPPACSWPCARTGRTAPIGSRPST